MRWDEQELYLNILRRYKNKQQLNRLDIMNELRSFSSLEAFSWSRANIVRWMNIGSNARILEVGAGWGAVTEYLLSLGAQVVGIEPIPELCYVNRLRNPKASIFCGDFFQWKDQCEAKNNEMEKFDYVMVWGQELYKNDRYILKEIEKVIKPTGKLVIAGNNRMGLRYFNGFLPENEIEVFSGIRGQEKNNRTIFYSKNDLEKQLNEYGFSFYKFYFPYPDYQFPFSIYSDDYLPGTDELKREEYPFHDRRFYLFNEEEVFKNIIKEGHFDIFTNSFLVVAEKEHMNEELTVFVKFSNERAVEHNIQTLITLVDGRKLVYKIPDSEASLHHVIGIEKSYKCLNEYFDGSKFLLNHCRRYARKVCFDFIKGESMEQYLDKLLETQNIKKFYEIFDLFVKEIRNQYDALPFVHSKEFEQIFGTVEIPKGVKCTTNLDVDLLFQNVIIDKDEKWNIIDYEWTFPCLIPVNFLIFRLIFFYFYQSEICRRKVALNDLYQRYALHEEEIFCYNKMEKNFQEYVIQGGEILSDYIDKNKIFFWEENNIKIQFFFNTGNGFQEDESIKESFFVRKGRVSGRIELPENTCALRIDPSEKKMILKMVELSGVRGLERIELISMIQGELLEKDITIFGNGDPQIICYDLPDNLSEIYFSFEIIADDEKTIETIKKLKSDCTSLISEIEYAKSKLIESQELSDERLEIINSLQKELRDLYTSKYWKMTAPIRKIADKMKGNIK